MLTHPNRSQGPSNWWLLLLLVPFAFPLAVPLLESADPAMGGMIAWWQLLLVVVSPVVAGMLYVGLTPRLLPIRRSRHPR